MTVAQQTPFNAYLGNGVTTVFPYTFKILSPGDLQVYVDGALKTLNVDYSVSGAGADAGGNVTFLLAAPAALLRVMIRRSRRRERLTDYQNQGDFDTPVVNPDFDNPILLLQDLAADLGRAITAPVAEPDSLMTLPARAARAGMILVFDPNGDVSVAASIGATVLSGPVIGGFLWPRSQLEINAGIDPPYKQYMWGDVRRFGAVGDDATVNTAALNNAIACNGGAQVRVPAGIFRTGPLTVGVDNVDLCLERGAVLKWTVLGAATNGITVNANNFMIRGGKLQGPASGVYVADENGIKMVGASSAVRKTGLTVIGTEITAFGAHGIYGQFLEGVLLARNWLHDIGYAGAMFLSSSKGNIAWNRVKTIGPGTAANMYGFSLTHDSTNYNLDPNAGTKAATNPFCWDWQVTDNHVEDINWEGIDCHGGYEISIARNHVFNTKGGIACPSGSGAAANYAGWNNSVCDNVVDGRKSDGTASGRENTAYGINMNGGATVLHQNFICRGNRTVCKGILGNANSGAIQVAFCSNGVVSDNVIQKWGGCGINQDASVGLTIENNLGLELGGAAAGAEYFISMEAVTANGKTHTIRGNRMIANGGTAGRVGLRGTTLTSLPLLDGNDFGAGTVSAYSLPAIFQMTSEGLPRLVATVNNGGAGETIDLAPMSRYATFIVQVTSNNAASLVTNLINGVQGQDVLLYTPGATAWTFNRANAVLAGGANFVASQYDTLRLLNAGALWAEQSRSANS